LETINLPSNLATISSSLFSGCVALTSIVLPSTVTTIQASAFKGTGLTSIVLPDRLTTINGYAFANTKIKSIVIPANVITIGSPASTGTLGFGSTPAYSKLFEGCTELETVVFNGVPETVYAGLFVGCPALKSVTLASGWTTIYEGMFEGCTSLNIELPASITTVEANAFAGWTSDQTITINISLEEANELWGEGWNGNAQVVEK